MSVLIVDDVSRMEDGVFTVKNIRFSQEAMQKIAIAGGTGSGKTSLLKMIAGLLAPSSGQILFENKRVEGPGEKLIPGHPRIAYHSQFFELRNHYQVHELLEMASRVSPDEILTVARVCRIDHLLQRLTHQLSGGERQRIALATRLLSRPRLLLLDEPYSNLDAIHKNMLKEVISDISEQLEISCILVSHDPIDTISWADEILVLEEGRLIQRGSPEEIYFHPVKAYTAALFGKYNLVKPALLEALSRYSNPETPVGSFIRPQQFKLTAAGTGLQAELREVHFMGGYYELAARAMDETLIIHTLENGLAPGDTIYLRL